MEKKLRNNNMLQRNQIEMILRVNGVKLDSPDEEIRSLLMSASFKNDDIDTAIMILRENKRTHTTTVDGLHKVFRSDQRLNSNEVSSLLGIDVDVEKTPQIQARIKSGKLSQIIIVSITAISLASLGVLFSMYIYKVGFFYPTSTFVK
jgi:hypothetical protein